MKTFKCLQCSKDNPVNRSTANKFCNNACQQLYQLETETLPKFKRGEISTMRTLHRIVKHLRGYQCESCLNLGEHNGKALALQLDHIDGDSSNNLPKNLRLLCPNCHSQTETYTAKNKGKGKRIRR